MQRTVLIAVAVAALVGCAPSAPDVSPPEAPPLDATVTSCELVGTPSPAVIDLLVKARAGRHGAAQTASLRARR